MIVSMGKDSATVLGHEELPGYGESCFELDGMVVYSRPDRAPAYPFY